MLKSFLLQIDHCLLKINFFLIIDYCDIIMTHSSSSHLHLHVINHNWSATKRRLHPQNVAEISRHSVLSGQDSTM